MKTILLTDDELHAIVRDAIRDAIQNPEVHTLKPLYTIEEACQLFDKTEPTLRRWARHGTIRIASFDGARYVTGESIARQLYN